MPDLFTVQQLADYLQLSKRTIYRLVDHHQVPAIRVGGQWRFPKSAVDYWLDLNLGGLNAPELDALEVEAAGPPVELAGALEEPNALIELPAAAGADVVRKLVAAVRFPEPVDTAVVGQRLLEREALCSTALPGGAAVLHTARWMFRVLRDHDCVAIARLSEPIDFGAIDGSRTDILALVLARSERNQFVLLTKMTRLCQERGFVAGLRAAPNAAAVVQLVTETERAILRPAASRS